MQHSLHNLHCDQISARCIYMVPACIAEVLQLGHPAKGASLRTHSLGQLAICMAPISEFLDPCACTGCPPGVLTACKAMCSALQCIGQHFRYVHSITPRLSSCRALSEPRRVT